jgi:hypothetical protein
LHLARSELALGRNDAALEVLAAAERGGDASLTLDILLLKAQAQLALARDTEARQSLAAAAGHCVGACPRAATLQLLQARAALAARQPTEALTHAEAALKLLQGKDEAHETGNAWRLVAAARLDIDRRLALPEKIARDWLLIGEIRARVGAGGTAAAYRHALEVADAAGLVEISMMATQALKDIGMQKKHSP